jgi:DNA-directed RNA polymerase subunit RPC12/RpoP
VTQQTLDGCAFCAAPPGTDTGTAYTWGKDERVSYLICVDCATQVTPDPKQRDRYACDSCGLVVDALAALTRFRVELGHLESFREDLTAGLSTLERLETAGEADLGVTVERLVTVGQRLGLAPVSCRTTLWTRASTNLVSKGIPETLEDHTERGATLWRKLVGSGFDTDWTYELSLDDERYQFDRGVEDGYITSLLPPEEAKELRTELEPVVPHVEDVYDSLRHDRPVAWFVRVIETVSGFCA